MTQQLSGSLKRNRGRPPIYDWPTLSNGKMHRCFRNRDYQVSHESFRALAHRTAKDMGLKVKTKIDKKNDAVVLQFWDPKDGNQ